MDRALCVILCLVLIVVSIFVLNACKEISEPEATTVANAVPETTQETTEVAIATEPIETVPVETEPVETEPVETEPPVVLYDVPIGEDLQVHIIELCEEHNIDPAIVMAMIWHESRFIASAVGDGGNSFGLMQIQPYWHSDRMKRLECTDLLDPFQNVKVGIDYLAESLKYYGDITKALVAYNRGSYSGTITTYAKTILAKAEEYRI